MSPQAIANRIPAGPIFSRTHKESISQDAVEKIILRKETMYPATPSQERFYSSAQQFFFMTIALPNYIEYSYDRLSLTWQAVAAHHVCLRSSVFLSPETGRALHRVRMDIPRPLPLTKLDFEISFCENTAFLAYVEGETQKEVDVLAILCIPQVLVDATSLGTIKTDFILFYSGFPCADHVPFASFVQHIARKDQAVSRQFWQEKLQHIDVSPILFLDQISSAASHAYQSITLEGLYPESGLQMPDDTPRELFEAAWASLLALHSGSEQVVFAGIGRDKSFSNIDACVGRVDHVYPISLRIYENSHLSSIVDNLRDYHTNASPHSTIGLDEILKISNLSSIQSLIRYTSTLDFSYFDKEMSTFPLVMLVSGSHKVRFTLFFNETVGNKNAQILLDHYLAIVKGVIQNQSADILLKDLRLESNTETAGRLQKSDDTIPARSGTLIDLFEERVRVFPDHDAVQFEGQPAVTLSQLNELANKIVNGANLQQGSIVPICMVKSPVLIASMWAVLKAGAAYVMLDPDGAPERNAVIVEETEAKVVLADRNTQYFTPKSLCIEDIIQCHDSSTTSKKAPKTQISPNDPAYIVYTSGSTGKPKGVILTHLAAFNGISSFSLRGNKRILLFYNPIFSAAQRAMLATVVNGGCVCMASKDRLLTSLGSVICDMKIDSVGLTPSSLSLLHPCDVPNLKQITLTGENLPGDLAEDWAKAVELRNSYGLSECTQLNFGRTIHSARDVSIVGRPKDTTKVYLLQPGSTNPVAVGVPGEICLSGPQLGIGYLKQPETTAKVFFDNPHGPGKLYRTGDLGMEHANGDIQILGRIDSQVKINGQRVEPHEISSIIVESGLVSFAAAVAYSMKGVKMLIAAVVLQKEQDWFETLGHLRVHVQSYLPSYMHPAYWLPFEKAPRNQNGKTDYKAIRERADKLGTEGLLAYNARPSSDGLSSDWSIAESAVREVWATILNLPQGIISRLSSFIELGGSSLQAIHSVTELRKKGFVVELEVMIRATSLTEVAGALSETLEAEFENPVPFSLVDKRLRIMLENEVGIEDAYPATELQKNLIASTFSGNSGYLSQRVYDAQKLELSRLKSAFNSVFEATPILRTVFLEEKCDLMQVVRHDISLPWNEIDHSVEIYLKNDLDRGITLGEVLFRVAIVQRRFLVVSMHHALFDFWSHRFLYDDVASVYLRGTLSERPPFTHFIRALQKTEPEQHHEFWKKYLSGATGTLLGHDNKHPRATIKKEVNVTLRDKCKSLGITTGAVIYSAWALVLAHQTRNEDVSFATPLSGRELPVPGIDEMAGPTLTTVPQRIRVDFEKSFVEIVKETHRNLWSVAKHSQYGMRQAMSAAAQNADAFDSLVNIIVNGNMKPEARSIFQHVGDRKPWEVEYASLDIEEHDGGLSCQFSAGMETKRAQFIIDEFIRVIEVFIRSTPGLKCGEIDIIGVEERSHLQSLAKHVEPEPMLLHQRFEDLACASPHLAAVQWKNEMLLTYRMLNHRANSFAHHLIEQGVKRGDIVPLYLKKTADVLIALLGVMKSGAAYLPLSPSNPFERNSYIIEQTRARLIVSHSANASFVESVGQQAVYIDSLSFEEFPTQPPACLVSPDDLAYVIYTSGSTGKPKGVMVSHRASAAAVGSMLDAESRFESEWRCLQFANYVFDASVQDFFNTLSSGGVLCLAPQDQLLSDLEGSMKSMDIRQAILTPTVARTFTPDMVPSLETLILGGEPMTPDIIQTWASHRRLLNVYGPTETSMVVTTKHVRQDTNPRNIGKPFATVSARICHPNNITYVPYGAIGELCIAGPQVTSGYLNRDDLTQEAYTRMEDGVIIYRTGDLARWLPGAEIECLGRKDNQVKISGHRIELGEIEAVILRCSMVQDCATVVANCNGKPVLAAFVIFEKSTENVVKNIEGVRQELINLKSCFSELAHYMVPKYVIPMGRFPALPSRKTDRKQLGNIFQSIDLDTLQKYSIDAFETKATSLEPVTTKKQRILQEIWADIFTISTSAIGANTSFIRMGGDSISAISMTSICRKAGYKLSVSDVLQLQTLDKISSRMTANQEMANAKVTKYNPPESLEMKLLERGLTSQKIEDVFPCPPGQVEFLSQGQRKEQFWVLMTVRAIPSSVDIDEWLSYVSRLTRINGILRSTYLQTESHDWVAVVLNSAELLVDRVSCSRGEREAIVEEKLWNKRFEFGEPFIRYLILNYEDGTREIAIKMDHALYDGTLLRIFDEQFQAIQGGFSMPEYVPFVHFALHHWGRPKKESMEFWTEYLRGYSFQFPASQVPRIVAFQVTKVDIDLENCAAQYGVTVPIIFQSAFQLWLAQYTKMEDIGYDYLLTGRNVEIEGDPQLINGNCAQFLPVRSKIRQADRLQEYLATTQADFWGLTEHSSLSLDDIFAVAGLSRSEITNKVLFLFQPFEPAPSKPENVKWVQMKGSQITMYQPYSLVIEISKSIDSHNIRVMYDEQVFSSEAARMIGKKINDILHRMCQLNVDSAHVDMLLSKFDVAGS
ncbi:hypothetical protein LOZ51_003417 [Ophidiomyces ophidiicola]|nr:hypothetical protein LOZ51_003417 [Ophidiomyces ophidiicola]